MRYRVTRQDLGDEGGNSPEEEGIWVKGSLGVYHQPPRFFLPLPGLDTMPLRYGLLQAIQSSLGVELPLPNGISLDLDTFYHDMNPLVFDFSINARRSS